MPLTSNECNRPLPMTGSERVRRTRERKRKDIVYLAIDVLPDDRDALIRKGMLSKPDRDNKSAIREALYQFVETYLHGG